MKQEIAVLRALLRNYRLAICRPQICAILLARKEFFSDPFIQSVVLQHSVNNGIWEETKADVLRWWKYRERVLRFVKWAEAVRGGAL